MRMIKTTTRASVTLDGDLLAIMETLCRQVTTKRDLERSFEDMVSYAEPYEVVGGRQ